MGTSETDHEGSAEASDSAFVSLLTGHQLLLRNFIASLIPAVDVRSDILQEVNILLWEKRKNFELGTNFKAWAFAVARYVVMTNQRRFRRDQRLVFCSEVVEVLADHWETADPEPDERLEALRQCMGELDEKNRVLLLGCYRERGAIRRIAEERGQPAGTIRNILLRLRRQLRRCIRLRLAQPHLPA